ncbi:hypothetical protein BdWA1_000688 [Babesia duncani]|uniref:Uncharacterized protein n=1 Tax=Babesia duncani TaxID=323732 RepID=A0AAD9PN10_9APIC|nr:hypothetical protein BdWA1_000688 [Babesia duncani]
MDTIQFPRDVSNANRTNPTRLVDRKQRRSNAYITTEPLLQDSRISNASSAGITRNATNYENARIPAMAGNVEDDRVQIPRVPTIDLAQLHSGNNSHVQYSIKHDQIHSGGSNNSVDVKEMCRELEKKLSSVRLEYKNQISMHAAQQTCNIWASQLINRQPNGYTLSQESRESSLSNLSGMEFESNPSCDRMQEPQGALIKNDLVDKQDITSTKEAPSKADVADSSHIQHRIRGNINYNFNRNLIISMARRRLDPPLPLSSIEKTTKLQALKPCSILAEPSGREGYPKSRLNVHARDDTVQHKNAATSPRQEFAPCPGISSSQSTPIVLSKYTKDLQGSKEPNISPDEPNWTIDEDLINTYTIDRNPQHPRHFIEPANPADSVEPVLEELGPLIEVAHDSAHVPKGGINSLKEEFESIEVGGNDSPVCKDIVRSVKNAEEAVEIGILTAPIMTPVKCKERMVDRQHAILTHLPSASGATVKDLSSYSLDYLSQLSKVTEKCALLSECMQQDDPGAPNSVKPWFRDPLRNFKADGSETIGQIRLFFPLGAQSNAGESGNFNFNCNGQTQVRNTEWAKYGRPQIAQNKSRIKP